jgi:hypothetical protein
MNSSYTLGTNWADSLDLLLNKNLYYYIWIHDPHFFIQSLNPDAIPQIQLTLNSFERVVLYIRPVYHHMMDKPEQRCESSESYSFTACIKNSISRRIGCRLEWDRWSSKAFQVCTKIDQIKMFEKEYFHITEYLEQSEIVKYTECLLPCHYTEYKVAKEPLKLKELKFGLNIIQSSTDILSRTEELIYDTQSFVAEFGGALGLFLGFSFIMIWDGLNRLGHFMYDSGWFTP